MSPERFIGGSALLVLAVVPLALGARRARTALMPEARGALAAVVEAVLALAAFLAAAHLLGGIGLLYAGPLAVLCAGTGLAGWRFLPPARGGLDLRGALERATPASALAAIPIALAAGAWTARSIATLDRGTPTNVDTYWYHMPVAARFASEHGIGGLFRTLDPVVGLYAADGSLLHGSGILLLGSDSLSPLLNLGFLALALLAAAAIGRASGAGLLAAAAIAVVMLEPVLRGTQPGEAKDDAAMLALLLAAGAVIASGGGRTGAMAVAGVALGLVAGVKVTGLAAAAALAVGAVWLAPRATRMRGAVAMTAAALLTGGTWYLRNLIETGSPFPFARLPGWDPPVSASLEGPWSTSLAHYATDFGVWADHFVPGLETVLGPLWWAVLGVAVAGAVAGAVRGGAARVLGLSAAVAFLAYVVSPTMAGGAEGQPQLFQFQVRHGLAALVLGLLAGAWTVGGWPPKAKAAVSAVLTGLGVVALGADAGVPALPRGDIAVAVLIVAAVAGIGALAPASRWPATAVAAAVSLAVIGAGYRDGAYLRGEFAGAPLTTTGLHSDQLAPLFDWAGGVREERLGVVGSLFQYPFYGASLSNTVEQLGRPLPHGGFDPTTRSCSALRELIDDRGLDYVVTVPRGIEFRQELKPPPEQRCLEADTAARRVFGAGLGTPSVYAVERPAGIASS